MPELLIKFPDGASRRVPLVARSLTLGRSDGCDVHLPSDEVSRVHAEVRLDEQGRVMVSDRGSKNGTRVDYGEPFRSATRIANHAIRIGDFDIDVVGTPEGHGPQTPVRFQADAAAEGGLTRFFPSSRGLDLNQQRLTLLMNLADQIGGALERKQLLEQALDACCEALGFERGLIALKTPRGVPDAPTVRNVSRDESGAFTVSRTLINRALVHGERAVVNNPAIDLAGNLSESLVRFPIRSALCVPILHRDEILGVVYGDRITQAATYTDQDVDFLAAIARQVGVGLANLRLFNEHLEAQKVYHELERARAIQRELLPGGPLAVGALELAGYMEPSSAVGGDYFDYFPLGPERVGFIIADVTGHGLAAALVMANLKGALRVAMTPEAELPAIAARLNRLICDTTSTNVFITGILGRVHLRTGVVEYVNAGHPAPLLMRGGVVEAHDDGHALPLGIEPDECFHVQTIEPGRDLRAVLLYTDGLVEAEDADGRMLDAGPVIRALAALPDCHAEVVLRTTLDVVERHVGGAKFADDLTLLAMHYGGR